MWNSNEIGVVNCYVCNDSQSGSLFDFITAKGGIALGNAGENRGGRVETEGLLDNRIEVDHALQIAQCHSPLTFTPHHLLKHNVKASRQSHIVII